MPLEAPFSTYFLTFNNTSVKWEVKVTFLNFCKSNYLAFC